MIPGARRRSPRTPAKSPKPAGFSFDEVDNRGTSTSKKILYFLVGLAAVTAVVFVLFFNSPSTTTEVLTSELNGANPAEMEGANPAEMEGENPAPSRRAPAPHLHKNQATQILARLMERLERGKFTKKDYRKMFHKVFEMYPDDKVPPHLVLSPSPAPEGAFEPEELDLSFRRDRRGKLKNLASNLCLSRTRPFGLEQCGDEVEFFFSGNLGRLQVLDGSKPPVCLEARIFHAHEGELWTYPCHTDGGNQKWEYNPHTHMFTHAHGLCLAASPNRNNELGPIVSVLPCDHRLSTMQWIFANEDLDD